jgi:hypothetical protein
MKYGMKHVARVPKTQPLPASLGLGEDDDPIRYVGAIVTIAAKEGAATVLSDSRARMVVRAAGETTWIRCGLVADLTRADVKRAFDMCIRDPEKDRMEVGIVWSTDDPNWQEKSMADFQMAALLQELQALRAEVTGLHKFIAEFVTEERAKREKEQRESYRMRWEIPFEENEED